MAKKAPVRIGIYVLRVFAPAHTEGSLEDWDDRNEKVIILDMPPIITGIENTISDYLPEGYYVKVES